MSQVQFGDASNVCETPARQEVHLVAVDRRDISCLQHALEQMELGRWEMPVELWNLHWLTLTETVVRLAAQATQRQPV